MNEGASAPTVAFSRDDAIWVGTFTGLGSVRVAAGGLVEIELDEGDHLDDIERTGRVEALRWGWAEPLAWARRGCEIAIGSALVAPGGGSALVLTGHIHEIPMVVCGLAQRGWSVLADRFVPLRWTGRVAEVQPTATPVLIARRRAQEMELEWADVRDDSDAVAVDVPRGDDPAPIGGIVAVNGARVGLPVFEPLEGHPRFEVASGLGATGALAPEGDPVGPSEEMARDLSLATLPIARLHLDLDAPAQAIDEVAAWWVANDARGLDATTDADAAAPAPGSRSSS